MKRRGIEPTINTYLALLLGMSKIEDWKKNPVHLEKCHTIYAEYLERRQKFIGYDKSEDGRTGINDPLVFYVKILGDAGLFQKVFDVFMGWKNLEPLHQTARCILPFLRPSLPEKVLTNPMG